MLESNRIEYKQELNDGLEKAIVAFLNYHEGGNLFIGIDKNDRVIEVADSDGDQLKIKDRLKNNISPSCMGLFDVIGEQKEGKEIIRIIVASGSEKPYFIRKYGMSEKGCFIRIGSAAEPMPQKMIEQLFSRRTRSSISKIKSNRQDLTFEQLKIYYEATGSKLNSKFAQNLELINEEEFFNYAAYLLADMNSTSIKVAKYKGKDRVNLIENNEYGYCSLVKATKQVLDKLELENKTFSEITSKERQNLRPWNPVALREAVINAIVHNDFTNEIPPKFEIFDDRIEITSAGGLPESLSQEEFFEGVSVPRNKELMRVFKDLNMVEHLGSGIPRILESYNKDAFKFSDNFLRMSFPKAKVDYSGGQAGGQVSGQVGGQIERFLAEFGTIASRKKIDSENNKEVLMKNFGLFSEYFRSTFGVNSDEIRTKFGDISLLTLTLIAIDKTITAKNIAEIIGTSQRTIENHLTKLRKNKIVKRMGSDKSGFYEICIQQ